MALSHSPQIVTRNLLLNLDFGNIQKCYNGSENLFTYSNDFSSSIWTQQTNNTGVVGITTNAIISPDGINNAYRYFVQTSGGTFYSIFRGISVNSNTPYTYSVFIKAGESTSPNLTVFDGVSAAGISINLTNRIISPFNTTNTIVNSSSVVSYPNDWYRCSFTFSSTLSGSFQFKIDLGTTTVNQGLFVYGAQLERGQSASPYVPTTVSAINRPTTATSIISNYSHTINRPEYISYDAANNSIRFDRNETFANFTGSITSNVLTVTAMSGINTIRVGAALNYSGLTPTRYITSFGTGIGTTGTYNVNSGIDTTSRSMTAAYKIGGNINVTTSGSLASNTYLYNDHTTEVWARINDRNGTNYDIWEGESVLVTFAGYHSMFIYGSTYLYYLIWDNTGPTGKGTSSLSVGTSGTDIIQGQWFQVVVTKSGSTFRTYLNGTLRKTDTITSTAFSGVSNRLALGSALDNNIGSFNFYSKNNVGCLKMYNTTLTDDEVRQNFNALRGRFGI